MQVSEITQQHSYSWCAKADVLLGVHRPNQFVLMSHNSTLLPSGVSDLYLVFACLFSCTVFVFSYCMFIFLYCFVSIGQVIGCEDRLRNDLYCVGWGVKLCSTSTWRAQWAVEYYCINTSSATVALGLTLSWFPTSAERKLVSNNRQLWFIQKLCNLEKKWQSYCQIKTETFLAAKNTTKTSCGAGHNKPRPCCHLANATDFLTPLSYGRW